MAIKEVLVRQIHVPETFIPDDHVSSIGELRGVVTGIDAIIGAAAVKGIVIDVVTGAATVHKNLAGMIAKPGTKFNLPKGMPYESAVVIGLQSMDEEKDEGEEEVTVVDITHGSQEKSLMSEKKAYELLQFATTAVVAAMRRGRELDMAEPLEEPRDPDQAEEPIVEEFTVTREMVAEYRRGVQDKKITLFEEVSHSTPQESELLKMLRGGNRKLRRVLERFAADPTSEL